MDAVEQKITTPEPPEPEYEPLDVNGDPVMKPGGVFTELCRMNKIGGISENGGLPEAGGIAWLDSNLQQGTDGLVLAVNKLNITARGTTPANALGDLLYMLSSIESMGIRVKLDPAATAAVKMGTGKPTTGVSAPAVANAKPAVQTPKSAVPAPNTAPKEEAPNAEGGGNAHIVKVACVPLAGGKYVLQFHEAGHPKYPDYSTYKTGIDLDAALAILNESGYDFTAVPLSPTETVAFDMECELAWQYSKSLNRAGKHYKNFVRLYPTNAGF
jgi:hypothetical protein